MFLASLEASMMDEADVLVVGSGAAGLTAALAAAVAGAETVLLEASARWGGTTSISGGVAWVPGNHHMAEAGTADSAEDALAYCLGHSPGGERALLEAYVHAAPLMARFVEDHSPIRFHPMEHPDTFAEAPGGRTGGRHLEVAPVALGGAGAAREIGWPLPYPATLTNEEVAAWLRSGGGPPIELIRQRRAAGQASMGLGMVAGLLRGCRQASVQLVSSCRARRLLRDVAGSVTGVEAERDGGPWRLRARRGVVLAAGGFEHDSGLTARLLGGPSDLALSPPTSRGDGLRLAAQAGAELAHLGEGWRWPAVQVPGEIWDDPDATPQPRMVTLERTLPHVLWVNQMGRRFVNEASHNCALALSELDPGTLRPRNLPAWALGDAQFRRGWPVAGVASGQPAPAWLIEADSLPELADKAGIDSAALAETVARFNRFAVHARDEDFHRGGSIFERSSGDCLARHPNLGTIEEPPFFALPLRSGLIGTKGGPRTDDHARVLGWDEAPIPGLLAAGNTMAAVFGPGMIANGLTLGTALTWGWLAGCTAAGAAPEVA
jgi:3-oxosteroid 1-dehydrogenase